MPAAARHAPRAAPFARPASFPVLDLARPVGPPSAELVAAVLAYADIEEDAGPGRLRRRVSAGRLAELEARGLIDAPAARAADLTILWDEAQGEVVRVIDDAPARARREAEPAWWESYWDEPAAPAPRLALAGLGARRGGVR